MLTTYEELKNKVLPVLQHYREDLTKHDFNTLKTYDGPFIYGYRKTGSDLVKLLPDTELIFKDATLSAEEKRQIVDENIIWVTYQERNTHFLYYDGKVLKQVTQKQIETIWSAYVSQLFSKPSIFCHA